MSVGIHQIRAHLSLARWLGPWTPATQKPEAVVRQERTTSYNGRSVRAYYYLPTGRAPAGAMLVSHGIHFLGPTDPRFDRFCRVLCTAGLAVMAPFIPDYIRLEPRPRLITDFEKSFELLMEQPEVQPGWRPGLFSISFGSLPVLRLAANPDYADAVGGAVIFGGYANWSGTMRYMIDGSVEGQPSDAQRNPLNRPVVFINLLDRIPEASDLDRALLVAAWKRYVRRVWPYPEMKHLEHRRPIIEQMAAQLPEDHQRLFLQGCGLVEGGDALIIRALAEADHLRAFLDPRDHLTPLRCPVTIVHGVNDDVIHHTQLDVLADALPSGVAVKRLRTGMYSHAATETVFSPQAIAQELSVLLKTLNGIVTAATPAS